MMWDTNMPIKFWTEAIRTACYLHQRSPTSSLSGNCLPYKALYSTILKIRHLRGFGCWVYKHIPPAQRTEKKFGNRSSVCMILGYVHNTTKMLHLRKKTRKEYLVSFIVKAHETLLKPLEKESRAQSVSVTLGRPVNVGVMVILN